jgi:broad specificity phosphatase PhoE
LHTTVYLIRNAETAWSEEHRIIGRRELGLSDTGRATAARIATAFAGIALDELLVSPLPRAVETADPLAQSQGLQSARDPRLIDCHVGDWEGRTYAEVAATPLYKEMIKLPPEQLKLPNGERYADVLARMLSSVNQALEDNELGSSIGVLSHAGPLRVLLAHYTSTPHWDDGHLALAPGAVTVLRFSSVGVPPALAAINLRGSIAEHLASPSPAP